MRNLSLNQKIFLPLSLVIGSTFFLSYELSAWLQRDLSLKLVTEKIDSAANTYMDQLNVLMMTGTIGNRQMVQTKLKSEPGVVEARLVRAPAVSAIFGPGFADQKVVDEWDKRAIEQGKEILAVEGERLTLIKPFKAYKEYRGTQCTTCHQVPEGTVMGAVRITYDLGHTFAEIRHNNWLLVGAMTLVFGLGFAVLAWVLQRYIKRPIKALQGTVTHIAASRDLSLPLPRAGKDELGAMTRAVDEMVQGFKSSLQEVETASRQILSESEKIRGVAASTEQHANTQNDQTDQVATAVTELDASSSEVRQHSERSAELSALTDRDAAQASRLAQASIGSMGEMSAEISRVDRVIQALDERCLAVDGVLEVIKGIADQTNLLALNAAIEAARAGEQGRGFAVVADEVRALSSRSRAASEDIAQMIKALQEEAQSAVGVIGDAEHKAEESIIRTRETLDAMQTIIERIATINTLNGQMVQAASEQSRVCHDVSLSVNGIRDVAHETLSQARAANMACAELVTLSNRLESLLNTYRW
ncbi:methyl-accepting chemotaxis protein [Aeromonas schubertii]|uniref:methyl-accepting chemotaxis protein n=1 Tax=Aeromonas schubertii TaxID=652 RepID=UPI0010A90BDC|nr:methyl-accepting chemotaxis protein [Aeromonas schubertii]QCG48307.1 methyl-accepting chemotaxis protein [Aeromonas schubertii]